MRRLSLWLIVWMLVACAAARSQSFDLANGRVPLVSLDGLWRFQPGDNPAWADPNFDDSKWVLLRSDQDWGGQGYPKLSGLAWYRFEVKVPRGLARVSVLMPIIMTCYEIYADGKLLGTVGKMPPNRMPYGGGKVEFFELPAPRPGSDRIVVALRVWHWPGWVKYYGGGPIDGGGLVGESSQIETQAQRIADGAFRRQTIDLLMCILEGLAALAPLTLFLLRSKDKEYLWLFVMLLVSAGPHLLQFAISSTIVNVEQRDLINAILTAIGSVANVLFLLEVLRPKKTWFFKFAVAAIVLSFADGAFESFSGSYFGVGFDTALFVACGTIWSMWMVSVLVNRGKRASIDARLILGPVALMMGNNLVSGLGWATYAFGWQHAFNGQVTLIKQPLPIDLNTVVEAIYLIGLSGILVLRFARKRSEEERITAEVQAAQEVQQYFIPSHLPAIHGFKIESAYRPAREVGGDFFQVLPHESDGSVLIVLGDVAGKGLQAGMLATLIVGAVRTAAKFTTDPKHVMALLNERLQGRGLVTCMAMRVDEDGNATLVNAGHLPPYLNGSELPVDGSLPLGAVEAIEFPALHFKLADGDRLMLMSDGIVEAQDAKGQLFGFDRIAKMVNERITAAGLATAAQEFGQEDDITVLTVARLITAQTG